MATKQLTEGQINPTAFVNIAKIGHFYMATEELQDALKRVFKATNYISERYPWRQSFEAEAKRAKTQVKLLMGKAKKAYEVVFGSDNYHPAFVALIEFSEECMWRCRSGSTFPTVPSDIHIMFWELVHCILKEYWFYSGKDWSVLQRRYEDLLIDIREAE